MKMKKLNGFIAFVLVFAILFAGCDGIKLNISLGNDKEKSKTEKTDSSDSKFEDSDFDSDSEDGDFDSEFEDDDFDSEFEDGDFDSDSEDGDFDSEFTITQQPEDATGKVGDQVKLEVTVDGGKEPLEYQWQYAEADDSTFYNSKAEGNTRRILKPPIEEEGYDYRCVITDADGKSIVSDTARVKSNISAGIDIDKLAPIKTIGINPIRIKPIVQNNPPMQNPELDKEAIEKFLNAKKGATITAAVEDSSIPMINKLGCGYDVFGKKATNYYVKEPVLDLRKLLADGKVQATRLDSTSTRETISQSIKEYAKQVTHEASVKGGYLCFKGAVDTNFKTEQQKEESNYFATYECIFQKYRTYILGSTNLQGYVIPRVAEDLANRKRSAEDLFRTYGHYVMVNIIVGGKAVYNCTSSSKALSSFDSFQIAARASYNSVLGNIDAKYKNTTAKEEKQFNSEKRDSFYSEGGKYSLRKENMKDPNFVKNWEETLGTGGALIDFDEGANCLIPIWEFCPDKDRAEELKKAFEKQCRDYADSLPVQKHQLYKYLVELCLGVQDNPQKAREEATQKNNSILIDTDLNKDAGGEYIYLARINGEPGDWSDAITDILISTKFKDHDHEFNHNEKKDWYRILVKTNQLGNRTFTRNWCDLNHCADGDSLWLYFAKNLGEKKAPIYDIMVYDAGSKKKKGYDVCLADAKQAAADGGWEIVCFAHSNTPADLNHNAGGNALFLFVKKDMRIKE